MARQINVKSISCVFLLLLILSPIVAYADINTPSPLPTGQLNVSYSKQVTATGGTLFNATVVDGEYGDWPAGSGYRWQVSAGSLPSGVSLLSTNPNGSGVFEWYDQGYNYYTERLPAQAWLYGAPTQNGTYNFTLRALCYGGAYFEKQFSITVGSVPLSISTNSLQDGTQNRPYNATLSATGGITPYTWSIIAGTLQSGLSFNSSTGLITGTPTTYGTDNLTFQVSSSDSQVVTKTLALVINQPVSIATSSALPNATYNVAYNTTLYAANGTPFDVIVLDGQYGDYAVGLGYSWVRTAGNIPPGMTLVSTNPSVDGWRDVRDSTVYYNDVPGQFRLSGTCLIPDTYVFTATATDYRGSIATQTFSIAVVVPQLVINNNSFQQGTQDRPYSDNISVSGGIPPYAYTIASGALQSGLYLNSSTGAIYGTPTASGTVAPTFQVTSSDSQSVSKVVTLTIAAPVSILTASQLTDTLVNTYFSYQFQAANGTRYIPLVLNGQYGDWYNVPGFVWTTVGSSPAGTTARSSQGPSVFEENEGWVDLRNNIPRTDDLPSDYCTYSGIIDTPGTYDITVKARDYYGSEFEKTFTHTVTAPPIQGSLTINDGAQYTTDTAVTLTIALTGTATDMKFSNDGISYLDWQTFQNSASWTLTSGDGIKNVYVKFKYNGYEYPGAFSDDIILVTTAPTTPSNLAVTPTSSSTMELTWQDNSNNEEGFIIERKVGLYGTYELVANAFVLSPTESGAIISIMDAELSPDTTYYYRVSAFNQVGQGDYSNEANATTFIFISAPSDLTATAVSYSQIDLQWTDNSINEGSFILERRTDIELFTPIVTLTANTTTYSDSNLSANMRYYYRIKAHNSGGEVVSEYSEETYAATPMLNVEYITAMVNHFYNNSLIYDYDFYQLLLSKLSSAQNYFDAGDMPAGINELQGFCSEVQAQIGIKVETSAGNYLYQIGQKTSQPEVEVKGAVGVSPALPFLPVCIPVTFTGTISPTMTGSYEWIITPTDKVHIESGSQSGNISGTNQTQILIHAISPTDTVNINFVFTPTSGTVLSSPPVNIPAITTTFAVTPTIIWLPVISATPTTITGTPPISATISYGLGISATITGTITTTPYTTQSYGYWQLGIIQNVISDTIVITYTNTIVTGTLGTLQGPNPSPSLDSGQGDDPVDVKGNFGTGSITGTFSDAPISNIRWDDPRLSGIQNTLEEYYHYTRFRTWIIARNTATGEIRYLCWWEWEVVTHWIFNMATPTKPVAGPRMKRWPGQIQPQPGKGPDDPILTGPRANDSANQPTYSGPRQ